MARKLKHASSRKSKHTKGKKYSVRKHSVRKHSVRKHSVRKTHRKHSNRRHTRRNRRREGGADILTGAPVDFHLSGSWPSQMSLGQGADYFKYHEGQHGGVTFSGAPLSAIEGSALPAGLRGPAHIGGIDKAMADIRGLSDLPSASLDVVQGAVQAVKTGGRRRKSNRRKSKKSARKNKKRGGAVLGYAPFPSAGMLLNSPTQYAQAGLNPQWKTDVAFDLSKVRNSQ
jgi:hypothetical protein